MRGFNLYRLCTITVWDEPAPPCGLISAFFPWVPSCDMRVRPITLDGTDTVSSRPRTPSPPHRDLIMLEKYAVGAEPGWYHSAIAEVRMAPYDDAIPQCATPSMR